MAETVTDIDTKADAGRTTPLKIALWILLAVAIVMTPLVFEGYGWLFVPHIMALIGLYVMLALGLNIVVGFADCSTWDTSRSTRSAHTLA